ncbi:MULTISPECIES: hypothetical protein [Legionella]|uniref:Uncharacterized protein n=1 Tax=Legionella drozanskii LLAP-1 TaxID=1212489 RepID=A0A0W0TD12_9GAMM|nr:MULTISPECIES: hypothetical protein [Legionella]KTC93141.1 hypothetical protein Ldro_0512 [Legionella drozanskii LLAP-1]PJE09356.1 MAG: hypothetical protein CK430_11225 [Legionella sp.]
MTKIPLCVLLLFFLPVQAAEPPTQGEIKGQKYDQGLCFQQRVSQCLKVCEKTKDNNCSLACEENAKHECRQAGE